MKLTRLAGTYAIARADPAAPVPEGLFSDTRFVSVSRTADELSVVAPEDAITGMDRVERGWALFRVEGPFAFDVTGVLATLSRALAEAGIALFVVSTYDTDYILVKAADAVAAATAWRADGHDVA